MKEDEYRKILADMDGQLRDLTEQRLREMGDEADRLGPESHWVAFPGHLVEALRESAPRVERALSDCVVQPLLAGGILIKRSTPRARVELADAMLEIPEVAARDLKARLNQSKWQTFSPAMVAVRRLPVPGESKKEPRGPRGEGLDYVQLSVDTEGVGAFEVEVLPEEREVERLSSSVSRFDAAHVSLWICPHAKMFDPYQRKELEELIELWLVESPAFGRGQGAPQKGFSRPETVKCYRQVSVRAEGPPRLSKPAEALRFRVDMRSQSRIKFLALLAMVGTFTETVAPVEFVAVGSGKGRSIDSAGSPDDY